MNKNPVQRRIAAPQIDNLLFLIDQAYNRKAWHGPNLRGSIRGLTAHQAARRLLPGRHNIWEIVIHCAYWKYIVRRRILGERKGSFPIKGSNWFVRSTNPTDGAWKEDVRLLETCHASLREAIAHLTDRDLLRTPPGSKVSNLAIVEGIASHDIYHAGQIQLLKRLLHS